MQTYYSPEDLRKIKEATDYRQLLAVALVVLRKMTIEHPRKPIAMVCGPISTGATGSRKDNLLIFDRAILRARSCGLFVFSQLPFEDDMERIYKSDPSLQGIRLLEEFYLPIFEMEFIKLMCFLSSWKGSTGARWEHEQAKRLKIPIIYLSDYYIRD